MTSSTRPLARAVLVGACAFGSVASAAPALPDAQHYGSIEYIVGGIGHDESEAIEHASAQWPLSVEFAEKDGAHSDFVADVHVVVRDAKGKAVLKTDSAGPFLLARLAPGHYTVHASLGGKLLEQAIDVKSTPSHRALMLWPAGTHG